ncbi:MAG: ATP-binding protein, partial [Candidatus Dormiibacterota bacterium]
KPMLTDREVTVTADGVPPELSVIADNQRLKQVLLNLVTNAVKYNRRGGRVDIAASAGHHNARISVADSGPGLGEEELARLFEPFERLSAATSDVEGTGLGLTLSKSLMEAMAGRIGVESTSGKGSTFWVELPLLAGPTADGAHSTDGAASSGDAASKEARLTGVVLYVEDNLSNVRLVEGIVARRPGVRLLAAMQGRIALDLARQHRPDLILMDVHIPDMDGAELLHRFAAEPATASVPVVVISADATPHQAERLLAAGAREYLTKPIRVTTLLAALDRNLGPVPVAAEPEG